jgi:hypothetical protein
VGSSFDIAMGYDILRRNGHKGEVPVNGFRITFSDGTRQVLADLSQGLGTSVGEVIREALSLYWWFARERSAGSRLLVQRGSEVRELRVPSLDRLSRPQAPTPALSEPSDTP